MIDVDKAADWLTEARARVETVRLPGRRGRYRVRRSQTRRCENRAMYWLSGRPDAHVIDQVVNVLLDRANATPRTDVTTVSLLLRVCTILRNDPAMTGAMLDRHVANMGRVYPADWLDDRRIRPEIARHVIRAVEDTPENWTFDRYEWYERVPAAWSHPRLPEVMSEADWRIALRNPAVHGLGAVKRALFHLPVGSLTDEDYSTVHLMPPADRHDLLPALVRSRHVHVMTEDMMMGLLDGTGSGGPSFLLRVQTLPTHLVDALAYHPLMGVRELVVAHPNVSEMGMVTAALLGLPDDEERARRAAEEEERRRWRARYRRRRLAF